MRPYPLNGYQDMAKLPAFSDVMATAPGNVLLTGEYAPETMGGIRVSGNGFQFLGVQPLLGRGIQPSDIRSNGEPEPVTVLSFKRWQRMGADPNVLGKTLRLNEEDYTIVGVMPPRFGWWTDNGVWLPMGTIARDGQMVFPITRLKPGVTVAVAEQQLHGLNLELMELVDPDVSLVSSVAGGGKYNFPHRVALESLRDHLATWMLARHGWRGTGGWGGSSGGGFGGGGGWSGGGGRSGGGGASGGW